MKKGFIFPSDVSNKLLPKISMVLLFSLLALLYYSNRKMIETPKESQVIVHNVVPVAQKGRTQGKTVDPLAQDIIEQFAKINGEKSVKVYKKICFLGKGGFAECFLTQQKDTNRKAATKIIPKKLLDSHRTKIRLANQIKLHKSLRNENVVEFYNTFEDEQNVYINLQVCENGSINDLLRARYSFKTPEVQSFLYGICQGLKYLHSRNIIHRDLKLGNLFLNSSLEVKIGDFGLACKLQFASEFKRTVCGTPNYIAPQILQGKGYHFQIDIWSLGVILFTLFFTIPPFETDEPHTTYQKIRNCDYQFPKYHEAPPQALELIKKLLAKSPADRPTLDQILESPFMKLGGSIPLGLPPSCLKRAPTKKQLANWPKFIHKQVQVKQMNSTRLGFFGVTKKSEGNMPPEKVLPMQTIKEKDQPSVPIFCKTIQQSQNDIALFYLNNGNFGVYDLNTSESYSSQIRQKSEKSIQFIKKTTLNQSGSLRQEQIEWIDCRHRVLMNLKCKQLTQEKAHIMIPSGMQKSTNVSKIHVYKDVIMVRLTNRAIQVIYKEKDGFLLSPNRKTVQYFYSFQDLDSGKEVDLSATFGAGLNDKQNKMNSSGQFSISSIFKEKKPPKHFLTMKKISYLKVIVGETLTKSTRRN